MDPGSVENGDTLSELADEIFSVNAIYGDDTVSMVTSTVASAPSLTLDLGNKDKDKRNEESSNNNGDIATTVRLRIPTNNRGDPISFVVGFDHSYPETPPHVLGTASTAARGQGGKVKATLEEIVERIHQPGSVCLFEVISEAIEVFGEGDDDSEQQDGSRGVEEVSEGTRNITINKAEKNRAHDRQEEEEQADVDWIISDVINEKKSVFVARAAKVASVEQAQRYVEHLLNTNKKVAMATHNISAWRIQQHHQQQTSVVFQDCDDDGETAAGGRLLHVMQMMDVWNVLVVVSRWFGGIKLGPDRFRIINQCGRDALIKGGFSRDKDRSTEGAKAKGKARK